MVRGASACCVWFALSVPAAAQAQGAKSLIVNGASRAGRGTAKFGRLFAILAQAIHACGVLNPDTKREDPMASSVGQYCIAVSDLERSVRFYTEIMGLVEQGRTEIPNVNEVHLAGETGGGRLQLAKFAETIRPGRIDHGFALWKIYINVDDAQATWARAVAAGYKSVMEPERLERWPVVVGFVLDPDGYLIEVIQHDGPRPGE